MGCSNAKQNGEKGNSSNKRSTITKAWRFPMRRAPNASRPLSYTESIPHYGNHQIATRPVSMFEDVRFNDLERSKATELDYLTNEDSGLIC
jgi:hypothetical protein